MECHGGKLIAYSLGNFVGYEALSSKRAAALSVMLEATLARDRRLLSFKVEPMRFDEERFPQPDPEELALHFINELSRLALLKGTVQLPISAGEQSELAYRHWRRASRVRTTLVSIRKRVAQTSRPRPANGEPGGLRKQRALAVRLLLPGLGRSRCLEGIERSHVLLQSPMQQHRVNAQRGELDIDAALGERPLSISDSGWLAARQDRCRVRNPSCRAVGPFAG